MAIYIKGATKDELEDWLFSHGIIWDSRDIIYIREPHGRLIDADEYLKELTAFAEDKYNLELVAAGARTARVMLFDAPTVIERSE